MNDNDQQLGYASKSAMNWRALFSWAMIIAGFSVATFLLLL